MIFWGKLLLTITTIICAVLIVGYFFVLSPFGIGVINWSLHRNYPHLVSIGKIEHHWDTPFEIILDDVVWRNENYTSEFKRVNIGLKTLTDLRHLEYITLQSGKVTLGVLPLPAQAERPLLVDRLQIKQTDFHIKFNQHDVEINNVNGGTNDWNLSTHHWNKDSPFEFTAAKITSQDIVINDALVKGRYNKKRFMLDQIGGDFGGSAVRGQFIGRLRQNDNQSWTVDELYLNRFKWQSNHSSLMDKIQHYQQWLQNVDFNDIEVTNLDIETPDLKLSGVSGTIQNIAYKDQQWTAPSSPVLFYADNIVTPTQQFKAVNSKAILKGKDVNIDSLQMHWRNGLIFASGNWSLSAKQLVFSDLVIAGINYVLPDKWRQLLTESADFPFDKIDVNNLRILPSIIVGIDQQYPFQFSALAGYGQKLELAVNHIPGIYGGNLSLTIDNATLNSQNMTHLSASLTGDNHYIYLKDFDALSQNGLIDGSGMLFQNTKQMHSLFLKGNMVSPQILPNLLLVKGSLPESDGFNLTLENNSLSSPSLSSGKLTLSTLFKPDVIYQVTNDTFIPQSQ